MHRVSIQCGGCGNLVEFGMKNLSVEEKEQLVNRLIDELYHAHRGFVPRYPWVFVRVLNKEQQLGRIILPENEQNKPMHEAIVIAVWPSFIESKTINGHRITLFKESELKVGDHVLLPHWAGLPVVGYKDQRYRIVKEEGWDASKDGGICGVVVYDQSDQKPIEKLKDVIRKHYANGFEWPDLLDDIQARFLIVDRDAQSVTISGR